MDACFLTLSEDAVSTNVPVSEIPYGKVIEEPHTVEVSDMCHAESFVHERHAAPSSNLLTVDVAPKTQTLSSVDIEYQLNEHKRVLEQLIQTMDSLKNTVHALADSSARASDGFYKSCLDLQGVCSQQGEKINDLYRNQSQQLLIIQEHTKKTENSFEDLYKKVHKAFVWHGLNLQNIVGRKSKAKDDSCVDRLIEASPTQVPPFIGGQVCSWMMCGALFCSVFLWYAIAPAIVQPRGFYS